MKLLSLTAVAAALAFASSCERANHETGPAAGPSTASEVKPYPLKTCIVQDEPLGSMGKPAVVVHEGQEYQFCCKSCIPEFEENPAKFAAKLADAQKSSAP